MSFRWGEPVHLMAICLHQMSLDRGLQNEDSKDYLDGRVPCFWICGEQPFNQLCHVDMLL